MSRQFAWCLRYTRWHSSVLIFCVCLLIGGVLHPASAMAGGRIIKEDSDNDGKTDRIVHFSPSGDVIELEADTNGDRKMDTFQYYRGGVVERIERDTDTDGRIDERDLLENGKTMTRQGLNLNGEIISTLTFDAGRRPLEWRRDTTDDGRMDTVYQYEEGKPRLVTRDTTGDGRVNVWQRFRNEKPYEKTADLNGDGRIDQTIRFDDQGRPVESRHDLDEDGRMETSRRYKNGELCRQERFNNGHTKPDVVTEFFEGQAVSEQRDINGDGRPEQTITYDKQGKVDSVLSDTNRDGRIDTWQYYRQGALHRTEQDRNHDGEVDVKLEYDSGRPARALMDNDGDGHFETRTAFDTAKWTKVTEIVQKAGRVGQRLSYSGAVLRKKEVFDTATGRLANLEEFDPAGKIVMSKEAENGTGTLNLTWRYDAEENAVAAEKDSDGDGLTDIWYHYENGRVTRVEEDRNKDGNPDLWEIYDAAQVVVYRSEDLDFDGTTDIERRF